MMRWFLVKKQKKVRMIFDYGGLNEEEEWYFDNINHSEKEEFSTHQHLEEIIGHKRTKNRHIELQVKWVEGDT